MAVHNRHAEDVAYLIERRDALSARVRALKAEGADQRKVSHDDLRKSLGLQA